jgi:hypothetical protein
VRGAVPRSDSAWWDAAARRGHVISFLFLTCLIIAHTFKANRSRNHRLGLVFACFAPAIAFGLAVLVAIFIFENPTTAV